MIIVNYLLAIIPCVIILFFTLKKYGPVPFKWFALALLAGIISTLPAFQFERLEMFFDQENLNRGWSLFANAFLIVGLGEEFFKLAFLVALIYFSKQKITIRSGIVFAMSVAMGFALFENILYAISHSISTMSVRMFTAVPAHAVFGIISGYFVGVAFKEKEIRWKFIFRGLLFASLLHGMYDWLVLQTYSDHLTGVAILVLCLGLFYAYWLLRYSSDEMQKELNKNQA